MSAVGAAEAPTTWERVSRTEFERIKGGVATRWKFDHMSRASILGRGSQFTLFLFTSEETCKPKAISFNYRSEPHLKKLFDATQQLKKDLGEERDGIHLALNAYFPRDDEQSWQECVIMRKYSHTLAKAVDQNWLSNEDKLKAMCQLARGIANLHRVGTPHRDVQWNNIMYDSRTQQWCLIDITDPETLKEERSFDDDICQLVATIKVLLQFDPELVAQIEQMPAPTADKIYEILSVATQVIPQPAD